MSPSGGAIAPISSLVVRGRWLHSSHGATARLQPRGRRPMADNTLAITHRSADAAANSAFRRMWLLALVLVAMASLAFGPRAAVARTVAAGADPVSGLAIDGRFLFVHLDAEPRPLIRRVDLRTGRSTVLYRPPDDQVAIDALHAGGGRVAIGLWRPVELQPGVVGTAFRVLGFRSSGRRGRTVISVPPRRYASPACQPEAHLRDVDRRGGVVTEELHPCDREGRLPVVFRRYRHSLVEDLIRRNDFDEERSARLVAGRLLIWSEGGAHLAELATGASRALYSSDPQGSMLLGADLDSHGNALLTELPLRARRRFKSRAYFLRSGSAASPAAALPHSENAIDTRFCGDQIVQVRFLSRARWVVTSRRGPGARARPLATFVLPGGFVDHAACDARSVALAVYLGSGDRRRYRVEVLRTR